MPSDHLRSHGKDSRNPELNTTSIGNYVLIKTLGEGNFAKVKLAKHKITGAEVFIYTYRYLHIYIYLYIYIYIKLKNTNFHIYI